MPLKIVIGKSNSGKSKYIYDSILKNIDKKNTILFVPPMARIVAEKEYLQYTGLNSITNLKITTISRYIEDNLNYATLYKDKKYMPDMAKKMYIKREIEKYSSEFNIFAKSKDSNEFISMLCAYFEIFEKQNITMNEIEDKYTKQDFTKSKLQELVSIYEKIEDERKQKFVDSIDQISCYINQLICSDDIKNMKVYFDSYNNFSKSEFDYIQRILELGSEVTITLNLDLSLENKGIFNEAFNTYNKLKDITAKSGVRVDEIILNGKINGCSKDIECLAQNIFGDNNRYEGKVENVDLKLVNNPYEEIRYIARDIREKIREQDTKYSDFTIYTNDIDSYYLIIKRVFGEYDIPVFCNNRYDIKNSVIVKYITLLLDISINKLEYRKQTKLIELLNTGLFNIPKSQINMLENYVGEFDIKGYMFEKEFTKNTKDISEYKYNLEQINDLRKYIMERIEKFSSKILLLKKSKDITEAIYLDLIENGVIELFETGLDSICDVEVRNKQQQILNNIYEVMDNISLVSDNMSVSEYNDLLTFGLMEQFTYTIPPMLDNVEVCDINKTRNLPKDYVYIIGVNENTMPNLSNSDETFTESELTKLTGLGLELKKTSLDRINMELFNIYLAINKCRKKLVFMVPSSKTTGESLRPSNIIRNIKNILDIDLESDISDNRDSSNKNIFFKQYIDNIKRTSSIEENLRNKIYTEYKFLENTDKYKRLMNYQRRDDALDEKLTSRLYGKEVRLSVSRLESLKRCPFSYYGKYILDLKPKKEYKLSKMDMGSIMHEVLEKVSRDITAKNMKWQDVANDSKIQLKIKATIDLVIDQILYKQFNKHDENIRIEVLKLNLKKNMLNIVINIANSIIQSEFTPLGYEIEFDKNGIFAPIELNLEDGKTIYLRGKIDRVDIAKIEGNSYIRVVDYKSSSKDLKLKDIKEGISLQLMTYMSALINSKEKITKDDKVLPAALNYFTLNTSIITLTNYEKNEEIVKQKIIEALKFKGIYVNNIEILKKLDKNIMNQKDSYIDVNASKMNNEEKYLNEDKFQEECNNIKETLKSISKEIVGGIVKIAPYDQKNCEYCEYREVCRRKSVV